MATPPNGLLNLGGCGVLLPSLQPDSSTVLGFLVPRRSISVFPLSWSLVRRSWVLDARTASSGVVSAEADASSSELRHIEKDLTFSPTFTDYVKIMESVKLDRSKNLQGGDSDGRNSRRRLTGNGDALVSRGVDGKLGNPRKKSFERKKGFQREQGRGEAVGVNLGKNVRQSNANRLVKNRRGGQGQVNEYLQKNVVQGELTELGESFESSDERQVKEYLNKRIVQGEVRESRSTFEKRDRGHVEEYVHKRMVRGEACEIGSNIKKNDHGRFASHAKNKNAIGYMIDHQSVRNKHVQSNAQKNSQRWETFPGSDTSVPLDHNSLLNNTKSIVRTEKEYFTYAKHSTDGHDFKYFRDGRFSDSKVNANGKFQGSQQRIERSRSLAVDRGKGNETDFTKPTVSRGHKRMQRTSEHNSHPSHVNTNGLKHRKDEAFQMHRGENVQMENFTRRDAENTDIADRAAFKSFEVFTDVRNRPRVLRIEMEERIQKLASQLNATDVNTPEWQFSKMIHAAKIKFSDYSILRIIQILGRFGNWKRVLQVVEWLQSHERFKSYKSRYFYTTVLDVLGKAKRPFEALNIFYTMMEQLSSYPDIAAYHCIAVTLGQAGLMKELFDVIDCLRSPKMKFKLGPLQNWDPQLEPDLIVYNAVLNACVQQKQWEGAFWVLQQLKEKNIRPTNTTYGLVMEVMLACGKYNLVYDFFNKVEKSLVPGALNYRVLVNALWREGKIGEAVMAVKDMEKRGIVGSASLYYDLARCLCSGGRCKEALLQIDKICKVANKPLVVTYTGLIQTCVNNGSMRNAKYIFNEMCNFCSPNNVTCNIMLKSYIEHGMFEDAKDLLGDILKGRIRSRVYSSQKAVADKFTFNTFMEACAEAKKWDDFEYAFQEMLSHGYHFDERRHLRMVLDAFRGGKEQLLEATWEYLCYFGRVPPVPIIMERFCLKLREGDTMAAISCIKSFQESEICDVSSMSWFNLLTRNANRLKEENILKLVHELNNLTSSSRPSDSVYQNILSSCTMLLSGATVSEQAHTDQQMLLLCHS